MKCRNGMPLERIEVVERYWFWFEVHEVCQRGEDSYCFDPRHVLRGFWTQAGAIEYAEGLVNGTFTYRGPIRATVEPLDSGSATDD